MVEKKLKTSGGNKAPAATNLNNGNGKAKVYDLPTRIFHWTFGLFFLLGFFLAENGEEESTIFILHMFAGFLVAFSLLLRVVWGFLGSRYARFSSFQFHPLKLIKYFFSLITGKTQRHLGHNAASSYASLIFAVCAVVLTVTGVQITTGNGSRIVDEVHDIFAHIFLFVMLAHVLGVLFHQFRHRDGMGLSMINGQKKKIAGEEGIKKNYSSSGIAYLLALVLFCGYLFTSYNPFTKELKMMGLHMNFSEEEGDNRDRGERGERGEQHDEEDDDDDDDDDDEDDDAY